MNRAGRILVADDNHLNRIQLSHLLERLGHSAVLVENGSQALEMLHTSQFDLLLLDILMPEMDGYEVLQRMKAENKLQELPVIVISAVDDMESVVRCIELGADDYLPRPFDTVLLRARLEAGLEKKRQHDQEVSYRLQIVKEKQRADDLLNVVIPLGVALAGEQDLDCLLERIVREAMQFSRADVGILFLRTPEDNLKFMFLHGASRNLTLGGSGEAMIFPDLPLYLKEQEQPNHRNIATYVTLTGRSVNVEDAYRVEGYDFSGIRRFDEQMQYRSQSFLAIPLKDSVEQVIGVLELINAINENGKVEAFDSNLQQLIESMSHLAAVALAGYRREQRLREEIQKLHIELDEARQGRQVAEIVETSYFQDLQAKTQDLRKIITGQ